MQLDEIDLQLLHDIANWRELLIRKGSGVLALGRTHQAILRRRRELEIEIEALTARFLNRGLRAAGLPHAIYPATQLLPSAVRHPLPLCTPERVTPRALEIPAIHK